MARNPRLTKTEKVLRLRLARSVKRLRAERGWTQEEASYRVKLNNRQFQEIEYGRANVTMETLAKICIAFKIDGEELLKRGA